MSARFKRTLFGLLRSDPASSRGRLSPLYRRLLAEFVLPNSAEAVARSPYWQEAFREPVRMVLRRLKAQGSLVEPNNPRARMCLDRDESDLRLLSIEHGLQPTGNADELADRLLTIDPTGWLLGYAGELLQCAETADRTMTTRKVAPAISRFPGPAPAGFKSGHSDNDVIWQMLKQRAQRTALEGNLALCRNVHLAMANHLLRRNKQTKALQALCVVCVFDLCGARNRSDEPPETGKTYARFDAARASLAPWLVSRVRNLSREMSLSMEEIREVFLRVGTRLPIPRDSRELWAVLQLALEGTPDSGDEGICLSAAKEVRQVASQTG